MKLTLAQNQVRQTLQTIQSARNQKNYSQAYVAERMRISQKTYSKVENGVIALTVRNLLLIATVLDVSVVDLVQQAAKSEHLAIMGAPIMKVIHIQFDLPPNSFMAALQKHCRTLLISVVEKSIQDLSELQGHMEEQAKELALFHPVSTPPPLRCEVHSFLTFQVLRLYSGDRPLISLYTRKTEFEFAFRDQDNARYN